MAEAQELTVQDAHGVPVFHRHWAAAEPKASVVIAHGASEHSGRYARFAAALNAAGYDVWAVDHRGHGRTGQATGTGVMGAGGGAALLDDLQLLVDAASTTTGGRPVVLFGHSMGSIIAQAYASRGAQGLSAYVLSGPVGVLEGADELLVGMQQAVEAGLGDTVLDMLGGYNAGFEPARTGYDWLSRDEAEVDAYIADPFCGDSNPLTYGFFSELLAVGVPSVEPDALASIPSSVPVLLVAGSEDPVGGPGGAGVAELERRLRAAGLDVDSRRYEGARHEILNETNRDEVTADIIGWLDSHI